MNPGMPREPAVYGLTTGDGGFFYVGFTTTNVTERLWQHTYRARSGHDAALYRWMREVGISNVSIEVLQRVAPDDDGKAIEATWIARLIAEGHSLTNAVGRDGVPDSVSAEMRAAISRRNLGRPSWLKGRKGEEAGWTQERRQAQGAARQRHGTEGARRGRGCECDLCLDWERQHLAEIEARRTRNQHGTAASYKHGKCRCDACRTAYREYQARFASPRLDGEPRRGRGPQNRVDAETVQAIKAAAAAGTGRREIATRYGVSRSHVQRIVTGSSRSEQ